MQKVSVIVNNYNTKDTLRECLANLTNNNYENLEIIVWDNASTDGAPQMVKNEFPNVTLLASDQNKGVSFGYNRAFEVTTGEYILYVGSDAFPKKDVILGLVEYMEQNPKVGLSTAKLVTRDGSLDMDAHRGFPNPWTAATHFSRLNRLFKKSRLFNQYFREYEDFSKPHEIDACISHFMFVPKKVVEQINGWDEDYFVYGEDIDFCYRIKMAGYKIMYLPQFEVLHYKGTSVGLRKTTAKLSKASIDTKIRMTKASTNAMKIFYKKHYASKYPKILTGTVLGTIGFMAAARILMVKLKNINAK
jgi:GT2 family glycosyltransferase